MSKDNFPKLIAGGRHKDERGEVFFANDFDMSNCKRFYQITHSTIDFVRAWQGHKIEQKWFYCVKGAFEVKLIKVENWDSPDKNLPATEFQISQNRTEVLHIPAGYVNGFRALESGSSIIVYSDMDLNDSKDDDFRFDKGYWDLW